MAKYMWIDIKYGQHVESVLAYSLYVLRSSHFQVIISEVASYVQVQK